MGDLKQQQGSSDGSGGGRDEDYLSLLLKLGDLETTKQLNVDAELIKKLTNIWTIFKKSLQDKELVNVPTVFRQLLIYTAYTVLDVKYLGKIDHQLKANLISAIKGTDLLLLNKFSTLSKICRSAVIICNDPWQYGAFYDVGAASELTTELTDALWESEGVVFLEARLEALCRPKKLQMPHVVVKIFHILLTKGKNQFVMNQNDEGDEAQSPPDIFDPYCFNFNRYLEYLEVYILLWSKMNTEFQHKHLIEICPSIMSRVIAMLNSKSQASTTGKMLPKIWKQTPIKEVFAPLMSLILPATLGRDCSIKGVQSLLEIWVDIFVQSTDVDKQFEKFQEIVGNLLMNRENIYRSDYIYSLSSVILQKFDQMEFKLRLYMDAYLRAMMMDFNLIENLRAETPQNPRKLQDEYLRLSLRFINLANYFSEYKKTSKELLLTAFSLNPTKHLFEQLFADVSSSLPPSPCNTTITIPPTPTTSSSQPITSSTDPDQGENLPLPPNMVEDLRDIIQSPRWGALGHQTKGEKLKQLCTILLNEGSDFLVKEKKLEYVEIDYEKYAHLPSRYDQYDDGIEKNYIRPHEVHKKFATRPNNRSLFIKKIVKSANTQRQYNYKSNYVPTSSATGHKFRKPGTMNHVKTTVKNGASSSQQQSSLYNLSLMNQQQVKSFEINNEQLNLIKQYVNFTKNSSKIFDHANPNSSVYLTNGKKKSIKTYYDKKFLQQPNLLPFPGSNYDWIPDPKPVSTATATTTDTPTTQKKGKERKTRVNRKIPTTYICPRTPYQISTTNFKFLNDDFRLEESKIHQGFVQDIPRNPIKKLSCLEDLIPVTTDDQWAQVEKGRNIKISSGLKPFAKKGKRAAPTSSFELNFCPKVRLNKDELGVPPELEQLTQDYSILRASTLKYTQTKRQAMVVEQIKNPPNPADIGYQERQGMKKVLYDAKTSITNNTSYLRQEFKSNCNNKRSSNNNNNNNKGKENLLNDTTSTTPSNDKIDVDGTSMDVTTTTENVNHFPVIPKDQYKSALKFSLLPPPPSTTTDGDESVAMDVDNNDDDEQNVLEFELGIVWELDVASKQIHVPRGPKKLQENLRRTIMIDDAVQRVQKNLDWKSYNLKEVMDNVLKEEESSKKAKEEAARLEIARRAAVRLEKQVQENSMKSSLVKEPNWTPNVEAADGIPLTQDQISMALHRAQQNINNMPNVFYQDDDDDDDNDDFPVKPARKVTKRRDSDISAVVSTSTNGSDSDNVDDEDDEIDETEDSSLTKRKYHYYPDSVIYKAINMMLNGKTMKYAAISHGIKPSALCKRLHVMKIRKHGKLEIPPELLTKILSIDSKGNSLSNQEKDHPSKIKINSSSPSEDRRKTKYEDEDMRNILSAVVYKNWSYQRACNSVLKSKIPKVPYSAIVYACHLITKQWKEARKILQEEKECPSAINDNKNYDSIPNQDPLLGSLEYFKIAAAQNNQDILSGLIFLGKGVRNSLESAAAKCGLLVKDLACVVDVFSSNRGKLKKRKGNDAIQKQPVKLTNQTQKRSTRSSSSCDSVQHLPSTSKSNTTTTTTVLPSSQQTNESQTIKITELPSATTNIPSPAPPPPQVETPKPKPAYTISFPILRNPSIQKTAENVSGKPFVVPKAKPPTKEILDENTGDLISVLDEVQQPSKEDEIIAALPPCQWAQEDAAKAPSQSASSSDSENFELQTRHLLTFNFVPPPDRSPSPEIEIIEVPKTQNCWVELDTNAIEKYMKNLAKSKAATTFSSSSVLTADSVDSSKIGESSSCSPIPFSPAPEEEFDLTTTPVNNINEVKRSERIHKKPKLDFKSGIPTKVPNGNCNPSGFKIEVVTNKRKATENLTTTTTTVSNLQNGVIDSKKQRLDEEKEIVIIAETSTKTKAKTGKGGNGLVTSCSVSKKSKLSSLASSSPISVAATTIENRVDKSKILPASVTRKRTVVQRQSVNLPPTSDESGSDLDDDDDDDDDTNSKDPDYNPYEEARVGDERFLLPKTPYPILTQLANPEPNEEPSLRILFPDPHTKNKQASDVILYSSISKNKNTLQTPKISIQNPNRLPGPLSKRPRYIPDPLGLDPLSTPEVIDLSDSEDEKAKDKTVSKKKPPQKQQNAIIQPPKRKDVKSAPNSVVERRNVQIIEYNDTEAASLLQLIEIVPEVDGDNLELISVDSHPQIYQQPQIEMGGPMALYTDGMMNNDNEKELQKGDEPEPGEILVPVPPPSSLLVVQQPKKFPSIEDELEDCLDLNESESQFPTSLDFGKENKERDDCIIASPTLSDNSRPEIGEDFGMELNHNIEMECQNNDSFENDQQQIDKLLLSEGEDDVVTLVSEEDAILNSPISTEKPVQQEVVIDEELYSAVFSLDECPQGTLQCNIDGIDQQMHSLFKSPTRRTSNNNYEKDEPKDNIETELSSMFNDEETTTTIINSSNQGQNKTHDGVDRSSPPVLEKIETPDDRDRGILDILQDDDNEQPPPKLSKMEC